MVDDGYAAIVDGWPDADVRMPVKQRHIATRVYERLVAECGYSSVRRWVKRWRQEHRAQSDGFAELKWAPGSAQVDFGQARAVVAGVERVVHFLAVSFPYSNMRWVAALPGETAECVCQGLLEVFERTGMTPGVVVFDNATGVGHRNSDGTAARPRLFSLFCAHYGFEPRFRDPYSGHEKGSVENAVGFAGRNLMVPMPSAESFRAPARVWLDACERIAGSDHYRHGVPVRELFEAERDHMLPLPGVRFDPCDWRSVKADKTGSVVIDANRYLAGPRWRSMRLQAGVRGLHVAHPLARAEHVLLGQSAVVAQHVLDDRVDAALQPVRGAGHRPTCGKRWLEKGEELPLAEQFLQPPVAAAWLLVRPPPHTSGRLGVGGVVPCEGAFGDESFPAFVPSVQRLAPSDGLLGGFHAGQQAGQFFNSLPAWSRGLEVRSVRVLRCTCTRWRWIRVPGHVSRHAASAPRSPSVISTSGVGIPENRAR